jgi:hypothetical protein
LTSNSLAGFGVDELAVDAMAGVAIEDMKRDALGRRGRGIERDRAGHLAEFENAFPVRACRHDPASSSRDACSTLNAVRVFRKIQAMREKWQKLARLRLSTADTMHPVRPCPLPKRDGSCGGSLLRRGRPENRGKRPLLRCGG